MGGGHVHFVVDLRGSHVEGSTENAREGQDVVDLVRVIRPAGGDHFCAASFGILGENLRGGVGAGEDDGVPIHGLDHFRGEGAGGGDADEHICPADDVSQLAGFFLAVCDLGHLGFDPVEVFPTLVDGAGAVGHNDVLVSGGQE